MSEVTIFQNDQFGKIRTMTIDGEPWFVGKDVTEALGYSNSREAITDHVGEEDRTDGVTIRDAIGKEQRMVVINESGLYSLILKSKLPSAENFQHWVTSEVLPSIRKKGSYSTKPMTQAELILRSAQQLVEQERRMAALENEQRHINTKVDELETLFESKLDPTVGMDWYTITGYISLMKYRVNPSDYVKLGKRASQLSRQKGYKIGFAPYPLYGTVGVYSTDILKEVFNNYKEKW